MNELQIADIQVFGGGYGDFCRKFFCYIDILSIFMLVTFLRMKRIKNR